jgi:hypothetical protein
MPGNPFAPNQTPVDSLSDQGFELVDAPTEQESADFELVAAQELANRHLLAELQSLLTTDDFVGNFNDALSLFTEHEEQLDNAYDILALPFLLSQAEEQNRPGILENFCAYYTFKSDLLRQRLKRNLRNQSSMALPLEAASIAATGKTSKDRAKKKLDPFQEKTQKRQTELLDDFTKLKGKLISLTYAAEHFIRIVTDGIFTPAPLSAEALENLKTLNRIAFGLSHLFFSPTTVGLTFSNFDEQYRAATARCPRDKFSPLTFPLSGDFSPEIYADLLREAADRIDTHSPQLASVLEHHQDQIGYIINRQKQHPSHSFIVPRYPLTTQCIMFAAHETVNAKASFFATLRNLIIRGGSKDLYSASATVLKRFFAKEIRLDLDEVMVLLNSIAVATKRLSATILETIFNCLSEEWAEARAEFFPGTSAQNLYLRIYNAVAPTWREITSQQKDTKEFGETFPRLTLESYRALLGILDTKTENEDELIFAAELCLTMNPVISSSAKKMPQLLQDAIKILEKINTSEQPQKEFFLNLALNRKLWGDAARDLTYCIISNGEQNTSFLRSLIGLTKLMPQLLHHEGPEKLTLSIFAAIFVNCDINRVFHPPLESLDELLQEQEQIKASLAELMPHGEEEYLIDKLKRIKKCIGEPGREPRYQNKEQINQNTHSLLNPIYPLLIKFPFYFFELFSWLSLTFNHQPTINILLKKIAPPVLNGIFSAAQRDQNLSAYRNAFLEIGTQIQKNLLIFQFLSDDAKQFITATLGEEKMQERPRPSPGP